MKVKRYRVSGDQGNTAKRNENVKRKTLEDLKEKKNQLGDILGNTRKKGRSLMTKKKIVDFTIS